MNFAGAEVSVEVEMDDLRRAVVDLRRQLADMQRASSKTFGELAEAWAKRVSKRREDKLGPLRQVKHMAALAHLKEHDLKKGAIDDCFSALLKENGGPLAPQSINPLRAVGRRIIRDAIANGDWFGANPFDGIDRMPEPEPDHGDLLIDEARRLLAHLRESRVDRYRLMKVMLTVGMRPGEAFALHKADVDFIRMSLHIHRSNDRPRTKTGKPRRFPIPDSIVDDLRAAIADSPNELVFPGMEGQQQSKNSRLSEYVRVAMGRAGVVTGYRHICRRWKCRFREERKDSARAPCPACGFVLWVSPIPKYLRFYDLRHTAATLHTEAGCHPKVVQEVLGHAATSTTEKHYLHLSQDFIRKELGKLQLGGDR